MHVRERGLQRAPDSELIRIAHVEGRVVITFDLDFGEILALAVADGPSVVIFRLADERADALNRRRGRALPRQAAADPQRMSAHGGGRGPLARPHGDDASRGEPRGAATERPRT